MSFVRFAFCICVFIEDESPKHPKLTYIVLVGHEQAPTFYYFIAEVLANVIFSAGLQGDSSGLVVGVCSRKRLPSDWQVSPQIFSIILPGLKKKPKMAIAKIQDLIHSQW